MGQRIYTRKMDLASTRHPRCRKCHPTHIILVELLTDENINKTVNSQQRIAVTAG